MENTLNLDKYLVNVKMHVEMGSLGPYVMLWGHLSNRGWKQKWAQLRMGLVNWLINFIILCMIRRISVGNRTVNWIQCFFPKWCDLVHGQQIWIGVTMFKSLWATYLVFSHMYVLLNDVDWFLTSPVKNKFKKWPQRRRGAKRVKWKAKPKIWLLRWINNQFWSIVKTAREIGPGKLWKRNENAQFNV